MPLENLWTTTEGSSHKRCIVYNGLHIFKTYQQLRRGEESKIDSDELLISKPCNQSQNKKKRLNRTIHQVNSQSEKLL